MEHRKYTKKWLAELQKADAIFIATLRQAMQSAGAPLPRIRKCMRSLMRNPDSQIVKLQKDISRAPRKNAIVLGSVKV